MKHPMVWVTGGLLIFFIIFRFISGGEMDQKYYAMDNVLQAEACAEVQGTLDHIEIKPKSFYFYLKKVSVTFANTKQVYCFSDFLAVLSKVDITQYQPGNILQISGSVMSFDSPANPGQFDEKSYYKEKNIYYKISGTFCRIANPEKNSFLTALYQIKEVVRQVYRDCLPEREAGIITAMLLGDKSALAMDVRQLYQANGIGHLLAISGLHVSIICMVLYEGLRLLCYWISGAVRQHSGVPPFFGNAVKRVPFIFTVFFLISYGKMTGFGISTSRAVIMMILMLLAREWGKSYDAFTAMGISAAFIWIQKPYAVFSGSFLLSYSAMAGVYLVLPAMEVFVRGTWEQQQEALRKKRRRERELAAGGAKGKLQLFLLKGKDRFISSFLCSAAVWIATLPVMCYFFYEYPTYGIILNLFVLPLASLLVVAGLAGGLLGACCLPLGKAVLLIVRGILFFYEKICSLFQKFPYSIHITGRPKGEYICLYYLIVFFLCFLLIKGMFRRKHFIRFCHFFMSCLLALGISVLFYTEKVRGFSCTVMDVGQGDGIVLRTETGKTILIDGGSTSVSQVGKYRIIPFLKYYGISHIDYIIMTHEDEDHISGQEELMETGEAYGISVGCLLLPEPDGGIIGRNYGRMERLAGKAGIPCKKIHKGDRLVFGKLCMVCLHPEKGFAAESANAYSTTLDVRYGERSMLLTGDLEKNGEEAVAESLQDYEILKTAHHGSKNSSGEEILEKIRPKAAVISCGKKNRYGHPHKELLGRLAVYAKNIYRTDEMGAIFFRTDGEDWNISGYRQSS